MKIFDGILKSEPDLTLCGEAEDICKICLVKDQNLRPTIDQIETELFFHEISLKSISMKLVTPPVKFKRFPKGDTRRFPTCDTSEDDSETFRESTLLEEF